MIIKRTHFLNLLVLGSALLMGCDKSGVSKDFTMSFSTSVEIAANYGVYINQSHISEKTATKSSSLFTDNKTSAELIEKAVIKSLSLQFSSPAGGNLNFLKTADVYLNGEGLTEMKIGSISSISNDNKLIVALSPDSSDIRKFVILPELQIRLETTEDDFTNTAQTITPILSITVTGEQE